MRRQSRRPQAFAAAWRSEMRIVRVMSSDPACQPNCAEWIWPEGRIMPGNGAAFAKAIANLRGRRLPVLVSSGGGSLTDAAAMGQLIRQKRLAVAVARTLIERCPARAGPCPGPKGQAITGGAKCASACPFILAGGVEMFVGPAAMVGVHQITAVTKEPAGTVARTRSRRSISQPAPTRRPRTISWRWGRSSGHGAYAQDPGGNNSVATSPKSDRPALRRLPSTLPRLF